MLAAHLAVEAERTGDAPAWLIDTDRQGTLSQWHERRKAETPQRGEMRFDRLMTGLATSPDGAAYCFIDTAPTISTKAPPSSTLPTWFDSGAPIPRRLWAVTETVALVKNARKPFLFVITQAKPQATITAQTVAALSEHGRVAQAFIADRVAYAAAMTGGTRPRSFPQGAAAEEIAACGST